MNKITSIAAALAMSAMFGGVLVGCDSDNERDDTGTLPGDNNPPSESGNGNTTASFWLEGPDPAAQQNSNHDYQLNGIVFYNQPVVGAEVCIDTSRSFTCDENSPTAVTNEDGSFSLSVSVPYATPEFFVLAKMPANQDEEAHVFTENGTTTLAARGYYEGVINPATTLEAHQYDPELSYLQQLERYSISRLLVASIYDLNRTLNIANGYQQEAASTNTSEVAAYNADVFALYTEALEHVAQPYQALNLIAQGIEFDMMAAGAIYFGYKQDDGTFGELSSAQRALVQDAAFTQDAQSTLGLYTNFAEVRNENNNELVELETYGSVVWFYEGTADEYQFTADLLCWNENTQRWVDDGGALSDYSPAQMLDGNTYSLTHNESGVVVNLHMLPVALYSDLATASTYAWNEVLDLNTAAADGALVRGRYEYTDALCVYDSWNSTEHAQGFSDMSNSEIAEFVRAGVHEAQGYSIDSSNQLITWASNGDTAHYRVVERGDVELLFVVSVDGSPARGDWRTWVWQQGTVEEVEFESAERINALVAGFGQFVVSDSAAVNLADQLRAIAQESL